MEPASASEGRPSLESASSGRRRSSRLRSTSIGISSLESLKHDDFYKQWASGLDLLTEMSRLKERTLELEAVERRAGRRAAELSLAERRMNARNAELQALEERAQETIENVRQRELKVKHRHSELKTLEEQAKSRENEILRIEKSVQWYHDAVEEETSQKLKSLSEQEKVVKQMEVELMQKKLVIDAKGSLEEAFVAQQRLFALEMKEQQEKYAELERSVTQEVAEAREAGFIEATLKAETSQDSEALGQEMSRMDKFSADVEAKRQDAERELLLKQKELERLKRMHQRQGKTRSSMDGKAELDMRSLELANKEAELKLWQQQREADFASREKELKRKELVFAEHEVKMNERDTELVEKENQVSEDLQRNEAIQEELAQKSDDIRKNGQTVRKRLKGLVHHVVRLTTKEEWVCMISAFIHWKKVQIDEEIVANLNQKMLDMQKGPAQSILPGLPEMPGLPGPSTPGTQDREESAAKIGNKIGNLKQVGPNAWTIDPHDLEDEHCTTAKIKDKVRQLEHIYSVVGQDDQQLLTSCFFVWKGLLQQRWWDEREYRRIRRAKTGQPVAWIVETTPNPFWADKDEIRTMEQISKQMATTQVHTMFFAWKHLVRDPSKEVTWTVADPATLDRSDLQEVHKPVSWAIQTAHWPAARPPKPKGRRSKKLKPEEMRARRQEFGKKLNARNKDLPVQERAQDREDREDRARIQDTSPGPFRFHESRRDLELVRLSTVQPVQGLLSRRSSEDSEPRVPKSGGKGKRGKAWAIA